jgi:hypothetical protein
LEKWTTKFRSSANFTPSLLEYPDHSLDLSDSDSHFEGRSTLLILYEEVTTHPQICQAPLNLVKFQSSISSPILMKLNALQSHYLSVTILHCLNLLPFRGDPAAGDSEVLGH